MLRVTRKTRHDITESERLTLSCESVSMITSGRLTRSLAKSAILLVLTRKAGRFKAIVQLLKLDLDRQVYRSMRGKHEATISAGWIEVRHATY